MHRVEDKPLLSMRDREHALHSENVFATLLKELTDPRLHELQVELAELDLAQVARGALVEAHALDARIVHGRRLARVQKVWVCLEGTFEIEAVQLENGVYRDVGM